MPRQNRAWLLALVALAAMAQTPVRGRITATAAQDSPFQFAYMSLERVSVALERPERPKRPCCAQNHGQLEAQAGNVAENTPPPAESGSGGLLLPPETWLLDGFRQPDGILQYQLEHVVAWLPLVERWRPDFMELEPALVLAVIAQESKGDPKAYCGFQGQGAACGVGLMQVVPATWTMSEEKLLDPAKNIYMGMWMLHHIWIAAEEDYGYAPGYESLRATLAAYNCGWDSLLADRCYSFGGWAYADEVLAYWMPKISRTLAGASAMEAQTDDEYLELSGGEEGLAGRPAAQNRRPWLEPKEPAEPWTGITDVWDYPHGATQPRAVGLCGRLTCHRGARYGGDDGMGANSCPADGSRARYRPTDGDDCSSDGDPGGYGGGKPNP